MNSTITICDEDRRVDYTLEVLYDFSPGTRPRVSDYDGGDPGEGPRVEVYSCRCSEVVTWCGEHGVESMGLSDREEKAIGLWCLQKYREEIEAAVLEAEGVEAR